MQGKTIVLSIVTLIGLIALFLIFKVPTVSSLLNHILNVNPLAWILSFGAIISMAVALTLTLSENSAGCLAWIVTGVFSAGWIFWLVAQGPLMFSALYHQTSYQESGLIEQSRIRDVAYTVANTNFNSQNPYSKSGPGDLDFIDGHWISSIDPKDLNVFSLPTQGIFIYDPDGEDKVVQVLEQFPFSEAGWLGNSATYFVRNVSYFTEFSEVVYKKLPGEDTGYIAVTSLIKRDGFVRYPYLWKVLVVFPDGRFELLDPKAAETDPRLEGVAIRSEWLTKQQVIAYGWRYGAWKGFVNRLGRIDIQTSAVNDENSAPFHMETPNGYMWYAPFSPLGSGSMIGMAMASSKLASAPIAIWSLPENQAIFAADSLVAEIESSLNHQLYNWYRVSAESACGNVQILELVPLVRKEADGNHLYYMGYVAPAPKATQVMFFSIIDPFTRIVYQDLLTANDVDSWLSGEYELTPQSAGDSVVIELDPGICDITAVPAENLLQEIERRLTGK